MHAVATALVQIARGMAAIHEAGHVHGDLNCNNVLIKRGIVKISDLGHATTPKRFIAACGKRTHISPEVLRGGPLSFSSDVYAFGIVS